MVKAEVLSASGRRRTKSVLAREEGRDDVFIGLVDVYLAAL